MHHGVFKEHKFHGGYKIIVAQHCFLQQSVQLVPFGYWHVLGLANSLSKVTVDVGFFTYDCLVNFLQSQILFSWDNF